MARDLPDDTLAALFILFPSMSHYHLYAIGNALVDTEYEVSDELLARMGVSKQAISKWLKEGVPGRRVRAFCNATGSLLVSQYADLQRAMRYCSGRSRDADRIAEIASHSEAA